MDYSFGEIAGYAALLLSTVMWLPWVIYRFTVFFCRHQYTGWCGSQFGDESGGRYFAFRVRWCDECEKLDKQQTENMFEFNRWTAEAENGDWYG